MGREIGWEGHRLEMMELTDVAEMVWIGKREDSSLRKQYRRVSRTEFSTEHKQK